jgi:CheY-like chemotaxis protein
VPSGPTLPAGQGPLSLPAHQRHILIIEDNADGRESLKTLLELLGHRVEAAADGPQGIEQALAVRPEVALVDIGLPGLDGYQVAQRIRAALGREVVLVALTGFSQPDDHRRAQEADFDAHLVKPVELEALQALLARPRV